MTLSTDLYEIACTKLELPRRNFPLVSRQALLDRLDEGLKHKIILVSASAGSGKTTLVGEWLDARRFSLPPFAWISLEGGDNNPVRFWRSILTACRVFGSGLGERGLQQLQNWPNPHFETILNGWINEFSEMRGEGILCLDDYHVIASAQIHETMRFLIDHLPGKMHLVILTRDASGLPLARLNAHHEVYELRTADLRFSQAETRAFFEMSVPYRLSGEDIAQLAERTEGWAVGLRLAALALKRRPDPAYRKEFLTSLSANPRIFQDYLFSDVIDAQPEEIREFLLKTSILERMCGSLCNAVTGREDGQHILARLEKANLFLTPLKGDENWWGYHSLFAEVLRQEARRRFGDEQMSGLFLKASAWFETEGLLVEAVEASLRGELFERAANLLERMIAYRLVKNEHHVLRRLIERLPRQILAARPRLGFSLAMAIFFTSNQRSMETIDQLEQPLRLAEEAWQAGDNMGKLGEALAFHAIVHWRSGNYQQSCQAARQALDLLPVEEMQWRSVGLIVQGTEALLNGELSAGWKMLTQAQSLSQSARNPYGVLQTMHLLGEISLKRGDVDGARRLFTQTLEQAEQFAHMPILEQGYALLGLAEAAFEKNELDLARQQAGLAAENGRQTGDGYSQSRVSLLLARIAFAEGDRRAVKEHLQATLRPAQQVGGRLIAPDIQAFGVRFALACGDHAGALRWLEDWQDQAPFASAQPAREILARARLHLAADQLDRTVELLSGYAEQTKAHEQVGLEIDYLLLLALVQTRLGQTRPAVQTMLEALALAQPGGLLRKFLDEGEGLFAPLQTCREAVETQKQGQLLPFYEEVLRAISQEKRGEEGSQPAGMPRGLYEALSPQEERVSHLLARGFSYKEIAAELVLSINTVKTHVKGVYRKLNVAKRGEVREWARKGKGNSG